ncbi:phage minor head protein [Streptomyces sp. NPDC059063]|uniref:phage minor head protein n=1 Tax=Streptomyces sp. NPDC059063 TaxID=3346712 RepID=UPI003674B3E5
MDDDLEEALATAEETIAAEVRTILDDVADEFAAELADATELVAARFSVSRIAGMWARHVPRLMRSLFGAGETAARHAAGSVDADLPEGFDDLPGRYTDGTLPTGLGDYAENTEHLVRAVGERLSDTAVRELATGLDQGEDIDALRARLRAVFAREGAQLGETREERIARTEAVRAWNAATLAAARALTGPDRPLVKQWVTRRDSRVREAHDDVDGFVRLLDDTFDVADVPMDYPGDPTAPANLTINCRCILRLENAPRAASLETQAPSGDGLNEVGAMDDERTAADDGSHRTGAMIALMPTEADARRLAIEGGEPVEELHLTLSFLGEGADWSQEQRNELIGNLHAAAAELGAPIHAFAFGAAQWNPGSDTPSWVWNVGDDRDRPPDAPVLTYAHALAVNALEDTRERPELPVQHSPWAAHVCAAYSDDPALLGELVARTGPVTFDRIRVAFAGDHTDIPLAPREEPMPDTTAAATPVRAWFTPDDTAIAYEDEETGDGRIFARDSLYWDAPGPWPLQYADEMLMGHEGAELAGQIDTMDRDGGRIPATGVLYATRPAGQDAIHLLEEGAPLGVSVDLDDVDMEVIDRTMTDGDDVLVLAASLPSASVLRLADGAYMLSAATAGEWTADGGTLSRARHNVQLFTGPDGRISSAAFCVAFAGTGVLTAAAGDRDNPEQGTVVHTQHAGDVLMRITRARVRGATLVAMPAYSRARIVLEDDDQTAAAAEQPALSASGDDHERVVSYVRTSPVAVGARETSAAVGIGMNSARAHLARAAKAGSLVRLAPGLYAGPCTPMDEDGRHADCPALSAAASGNLDLPVHDDRDAPWDGGKAPSRILDWATGEDGTVDPDRLGSAFLYRDPDADPATLSAYKLPFADVYPSGDGERLEVVARAVFAIAGVLEGAMGGVDIPADERDAIRGRVETLYARLAKEFDDPSLAVPWNDDDQDDDDEAMSAALAELEASAWSAMRDLPTMPAAWFREPTEQELPPDSGGVHYADGRIYGWVAQAGEPHAGMPGRNLTIESLGDVDLTHFLRKRFPLDDGSTIRAGAFTMNVGHHRDGAECETSACQFDDTRTVAGIVTVGMNARGLWFSGAASPYLSDWDRRVFMGCQPSYHMRQGRDGRWQLRAVLSVPVPGHSSPLLAAAVAERANLALAASAAVRDSEDTVRTVSADASVLNPDSVRTASAEPDRAAAEQPGQRPDSVPGQVPDTVLDDVVEAVVTSPRLLDRLTAALNERAEQRADMDAEIQRLAAQIDPGTQKTAAALVGAPRMGGK